MSWELAADWFAVVGTALLTYGTSAQALANLAEFKSAQQAVSAEVKAALKDQSSLIHGFVTHPWLLALFGFSVPVWVVLAFSFVFFIPKRIARLRAVGKEAVEVARFLRLLEVWIILATGAAAALVAACIQLALA